MDFESETFVVFDPTQVTSPGNVSNPKPGDPCHTLPSRGRPPVLAFNARQDPDAWTEHVGPLDRWPSHGISADGWVRRLTPVECERLQGFPDDYTLVPYRGKPAKDAPRYRALGNAWAVPVARSDRGADSGCPAGAAAIYGYSGRILGPC